jgi:hypothetical protein
MFLVTIILLLFSIGDKKIASEPINKGAIKLKNKTKVVPEEGFYKSVMSSVSGHKFVIYDEGNVKISVFDLAGNKISEFGKEGNGPGELFQIKAIYSNDKFIYAHSTRKVLIFDYKGKLTNEVSDHVFYGGELILNRNSFSIMYHSTIVQKLSRVEYSLNGKFIKKYIDKNPPPVPSRLNGWFKSPKDLSKTQQRFVRFYPGSYKLEFLDLQMNSISTVRRDYSRIKETEYPDWLKDAIQRDGNDKARIEKRAKFIQLRKQATLGYLSDIQQILGEFKNYLFVRTSSQSQKTLNIDILNSKNKLYDQITIEGDNIISSKVENGKLLINYKNGNDGPYLISYDIFES